MEYIVFICRGYQLFLLNQELSIITLHNFSLISEISESATQSLTRSEKNTWIRGLKVTELGFEYRDRSSDPIVC